MARPKLAAGAAALALTATMALAADPPPGTLRIVSHVTKPEMVEATPERVEGLSHPAGFSVSRFADGLGAPRLMAVADDGAVYVTRRAPGDVVMLRDTDGDGRADQTRTVLELPMVHGIAIHGRTLYLATVTELFRAELKPDGSVGEPVRIIGDLPDGGQHPNRSLGVGPDGKLYVGVGSTCNACPEINPENATILRVEPDGSGRAIVAKGLRNTIGFGWEPTTGVLYGMDQGIDWLGDDEQPEEFNRIEEGKDYGWPYVFSDRKINPALKPPGRNPDAYAKGTEQPILYYTAHAAPMQMVFYNGHGFPPEYRDDAFVAMHGSWNRAMPSGYEVVRVRFDDGKPVAVEPFVGGFLSRQDDGSWTAFGRPVGLAVAKDGALLVSDDANGVIHRVAYTDPQVGERRQPTKP
ncbi:PQQ-dependent sugar dehydrogenase [Azospirillum oleiclasticum]|nr:PQQ-dependent sugar dehydrogenase [Azospirillum oleiclasticum]